MDILCRDCDSLHLGNETACPACGSDRLISHARLTSLSIAHIDCDAFFAAIEKRDNPDLQGKPLIVGGGKRGVVATCCYLARLHGVRSAMPMFKALKACPEAVVVKPRRDAYITASRQIRALMENLTPLVQMISIDEAYLDLTGTERLNGAPPVGLLSQLSRQVEAEIGITISIGLSENKFLAKTASELDKPKGFAVISLEEAKTFLAPRPVGFLHGVGPQLAKKLERDGFSRVGDLQDVSVRDLIQRYGETGLWLSQRANGIDNRPVRQESERKSVSAERTFETDISDPAILKDRFWLVCEETARRAKAAGVEGETISLKLKTKSFKNITRSVTLAMGTNLAQSLFRAGLPLLERETQTGQAYRLIGVGLSNLSAPRGDTPDLVDATVAKRAKAERASDIARERFGGTAVVTGRSIRIEKTKDKSGTA